MGNGQSRSSSSKLSKGGGRKKGSQGKEPTPTAPPETAPVPTPPVVEEQPKPVGTSAEEEGGDTSSDVVERVVGKTSDLPDGQ